MGFLSDIFDPGRKDRQAAAGAAASGVIKGFNFSGPGGVGGGFNFSGGRGTVNNMSLGAFQPAFQQLIAGGTGMLGGAGAGLPPELTGQGAATIGRLGENTTQRFDTTGDASTLGQLFQSNAAIAQKDPFELGSTISEKLRQLSERRNQRSVNKMFDRLQSTGNLTSSAGIQRAGDMERNLFEQGLQFDLAGLQAGQSMIGQAFGQAMGAQQGREAIGSRLFGETFANEQLMGNRAMDQFGVQSGLFGMGLQGQQVNQQLGLQQLQAAMGLQNLPMQQLTQMANLTGLASGSNFNNAAVLQGNASMAQSPFLQALNAAGQFAGNIGFDLTPD